MQLSVSQRKRRSRGYASLFREIDPMEPVSVGRGYEGDDHDPIRDIERGTMREHSNRCSSLTGFPTSKRL